MDRLQASPKLLPRELTNKVYKTIKCNSINYLNHKLVFIVALSKTSAHSELCKIKKEREGRGSYKEFFNNLVLVHVYLIQKDLYI